MPSNAPDWTKDWLTPGRPVVCVDPCDSLIRCAYLYQGQILPRRRGVYTIRRVGVDSETGRTVLLFEEIVNAPRQWSSEFGEMAFAARLFAPVRPPRIDALRRLCLPRSRGGLRAHDPELL